MREYLYDLARDKKAGLVAGSVSVFLWLLSLVYGLLVRVLAFIYRVKPYRLNCKLISVGNITLGGTGKTPLVEYIANYLREQGCSVAIISRGYKRKIANCKFQISDYETMGDEPYMLEMNLRNVPVFVDTDRVRAAARAIREHQAEIVLLDDGFQQWRLKKDLEIVAIDATNPFGNRQVLPRGILREPLSALKRADIFVLTKANLNPDTRAIRNFLSRINPRALIIVSSHQPRGLYRIGKRNEILNPDALRQKTVALVSGIGDPGSFENLIKGLGINVGLHFSFPDHHRYSQQDLAGIITAAQKKKIDTIITTEKDAIRISRLQLKTYNLKLFVFSVALKISENEKELHRRLLRLHSA